MRLGEKLQWALGRVVCEHWSPDYNSEEQNKSLAAIRGLVTCT